MEPTEILPGLPFSTPTHVSVECSTFTFAATLQSPQISQTIRLYVCIVPFNSHNINKATTGLHPSTWTQGVDRVSRQDPLTYYNRFPMTPIPVLVVGEFRMTYPQQLDKNSP